MHDSEQKTWRHLDFFQHQAHLSARVPRVRCREHGVHRVPVAWARAGSGFTLLFEALVMALAKEMPVAALAGLVGEHDTRIWRIVHHYVDAARARQDLSQVSRLGVDETSFRRGQDYVTVFADLDRRAAIFATPGRDADSYGEFVCDLQAHGAAAGQIVEVCQDISEAFLSGARAPARGGDHVRSLPRQGAALQGRRPGQARRARRARRSAQALTLPVAAPAGEPQRAPARASRRAAAPAA